MVTLEDLEAHLAEMGRTTNQDWMGSLDDRKRKELEFHDSHRDRASAESLDADTYEKLYGNKKYYQTTARSKEYVEGWIVRHAAEAGVSANTWFVQADAEDTTLPDESIDTLVCSGMLHHLDLSYALPELRRLLVPGGRLLAVEALDYNPLIKLYRNRTPAMRTEWEKAHILSLKDVRFARRFLDLGEVRFWHITSVAGAFAKPLLPLLNALDSVLTRLPLLKYAAWVFTFELIKPGSR